MPVLAALAKLVCFKRQPTPFACYLCKIKGFLAWAGKAIYPGFWKYLPVGHDLRRRGRLINNSAFMNQPPDATRDTIAPPPDTPAPANRLSIELQPGSDNRDLEHEHPEAELKSMECVFWMLPYYFNLGPTQLSSYDAMHAIAGVICDLFNCMAGGRWTASCKEFENRHNGYVS